MRLIREDIKFENFMMDNTGVMGDIDVYYFYKNKVFGRINRSFIFRLGNLAS
jgi:hypothetical protein